MGYYSLESWRCDGCGDPYPPSESFSIRYQGDDEEEILCSSCHREYQENEI